MGQVGKKRPRGAVMAGLWAALGAGIAPRPLIVAQWARRLPMAAEIRLGVAAVFAAVLPARTASFLRPTRGGAAILRR